MCLWKRSLMVLTVLGMSGIFLAAASGQDEAASAPVSIGVLDERLIFAEYARSVRYHDELEKLEIEVKVEMKERKEVIERIEDEINELEEKSRLGLEKRIEHRKMQVQLEFWLRDKQDEMKEKLIAYTAEIRQDIRNAAKEVAGQKGLDIILNYDPSAHEEGPRLDDPSGPVVIYANKRADITGEVVALLNRRDAEGKKPPRETPPGEAPPEKPGESGEPGK